LPTSPRRYGSSSRFVTRAGRRLRSMRLRRRSLLARWAAGLWNYSWLVRQAFAALALFLVVFALMEASSPTLAGVRSYVRHYLTEDYDFAAATRQVFSGDLRQKVTEGLAIFPDLWERLTGGRENEPGSDETALILPVAEGVITSGFGYRPDPVTGEVTYHTGIDIAADEGTLVLAALGGTVLAVEEDEAYGKMLEIDHGQGIVTLYAHLSEASVSAGDTVEQGDVIGKVGMTGKATSPHCHFEVIISGQPVDPLQLKGLATPGE